MMDAFAHMRPYCEEEVPDALQLMLGALDWNAVLSPFIGTDATKSLLHAMGNITSVSDFQDLVSKTFIEKVLDKTASEVTFSFPEAFDSCGALFISNHRDIVLDPSLINLALLSLGAETTEIGIGSNLLQTPTCCNTWLAAAGAAAAPSQPSTMHIKHTTLTNHPHRHPPLPSSFSDT